MSRRFKGRHAKVQANPKALPAKPVELDDENSYVDPQQPDRRVQSVLNTRHYAAATAGSDPGDDSMDSEGTDTTEEGGDGQKEETSPAA